MYYALCLYDVVPKNCSLKTKCQVFTLVDFQFEITIILTIKLENVNFKMKPGSIIRHIFNRISLNK